VSWVRQKDLHILTSGDYVYTSDSRFRSIHLAQSTDWTLEILDTQINDTGVYECQISTETKLSTSVFLEIIDVKPVIAEGSDLYLQKGASINLTCLINFVEDRGAAKGASVFWNHNGNLINYDTEKRGVKVKTEVVDKETISRLIINGARSNDSGNYSCSLNSASSVTPAVIKVHVLNGGENPAAMQHGKGHENSVSGINNKANNNSVYVSTRDKLCHGLLRITIFLSCYKLFAYTRR
ncbi:hypothetical protein B4U79_00046, partial [Dinothrombium tinctorium]